MIEASIKNKDKDKLFIVFYLNVSRYNYSAVPEICMQAQKHLTYDDSILSIVVPIYDGESKVECINPQLLNEEQYETVKNQLTEIQNKYDSFIRYELERR